VDAYFKELGLDIPPFIDLGRSIYKYGEKSDGVWTQIGDIRFAADTFQTYHLRTRTWAGGMLHAKTESAVCKENPALIRPFLNWFCQAENQFFPVHFSDCEDKSIA